MEIRNRYTGRVLLKISGETLEGANLEGANLRSANLRGANLRGANLRSADLKDADLKGVDLCRANLRDTNLQHANLQHANLRAADLRDADLWGADLRDADLWGADLEGANLRGANLRGAYLRGANLEGAKLSDYSICPEVGSFIGYKKASGEVVKLEIPIEAKRVSTPTSKKCRAEFVRVLSISNGLDGVKSDRGGLTYEVGKLAYPDSFSDDIRECCTNGIHFFMTEKEAEDW